MECYTPGKIVNEPTSLEDVPFACLPDNVWMVTTTYSDTMGKLAKKCTKAIEKNGAVVLYEEAENISKVILLSDLLLERYPWLHKYTKTDSRSVEEYWEPKYTELSPLKVVRQRPRIFIVMSAYPLEEEQPTETVFDFLGVKATSKVAKANKYYRRMPVNREELEANEAKKEASNNARNNKRTQNKVAKSGNKTREGDSVDGRGQSRGQNRRKPQSRQISRNDEVAAAPISVDVAMAVANMSFED
jgi:hypothetical protein